VREATGAVGQAFETLSIKSLAFIGLRFCAKGGSFLCKVAVSVQVEGCVLCTAIAQQFADNERHLSGRLASLTPGAVELASSRL
jgi:hypothetical protein